MLDEELGKCDLASEVDEVGSHSPPDAGVPSRDERVLPESPATGGGRRGGDFNFRDPGGAEEDDGHDGHQGKDAASKGTVEGDDASEVGTARTFGAGGHQALSRAEWVISRLLARGVWVEDECIGQERGDDGSDASPSLGNQNAKSGLSSWTAVDSVGVGRTLQNRDTETDDEHGSHHADEAAALCTKRHEQVTESQTEETENHCDSIATILDHGPSNEESARDVCRVVTGGEDCGLLTANAHCHFNVVVHDVEEAVGQPPHTEQRQRGDHNREDGLPLTKVTLRASMLDVEALDALEEGGERKG